MSLNRSDALFLVLILTTGLAQAAPIFTSGWENAAGTTCNGTGSSTDNLMDAGLWSEYGPGSTCSATPPLATLDTGIRNTGNRSLKLHFKDNDGDNGPDFRLVKNLGSNTTETYFRFYVRWSSDFRWASADHKTVILGAGNQATQDIYFNTRGEGGDGTVGRLAVAATPADAVFSDRTNGLFVTGRWYLVEGRIVSGVNGSIQAWVDGVPLNLVQEAGPTARNPNNLNTGSGIGYIKLDNTYNCFQSTSPGCSTTNNFMALNTTGVADVYYDDVQVCTATRCGAVNATPPPPPPPPSGNMANVWIDTNGGSCSRSALPTAYNDSSACSSFTAAYNAAQGGDILYVKAGTYPSQSVPLRSLGTSIVTLAKEPGIAAVTLGGLDIDASYIVVDGFTMTNGSNTAAFSIGSNNGCAATPGSGWPCSFPTHEVTLRNFSANNGFINGDTITVEHGSIGPMEACTNPNAEDGLVILGQGNGVNPSWTPSVNVTIDDVTIHDITNNGCGEHTDGIQGYGYRNLTIKNSRIYNTDSSLILAYSFDNANPLQVDRIRIENNYFGIVPNPGHGVTLGNDTSALCGTSNLNNIIQNNTFFGNMGADVNCGSSPDAIFRNNIVLNGEACSFGAHDFSYDYNVWPVSGSGSGCSSTLHAKLCNPTFAVPAFTNANADLATTDTCAKDAILSASGTFPLTDIRGTARPQGGRADAGAFEISSGTPPASPCDLDANGSTNVGDVQGCVNQAIGTTACGNADINGDTRCNVIDVQRVVNAALGGGCVTQ